MRLKKSTEVVPTIVRNLILGANLTSLSLARHPRVMLEYISESLFLYKALASRRGIPQKNIFEVVPSRNVETITLNLASDGNWFSSHASYTADIVSLCLICQVLRPRIVFEIGTLGGYTSFHFALNTPDEAKIFTLDLPRGKDTQTRLRTTILDDAHITSHAKIERYCFEGSAVTSKIECLHGDSATFDFSPFYGQVDFFFIDGAHSYEYVRSDTLNAMKCCHPGSVIAWHDFGRLGVNGVSKWILELSESQEVFSIPGGSLAFMLVQ